jgi:hypothetical protein
MTWAMFSVGKELKPSGVHIVAWEVALPRYLSHPVPGGIAGTHPAPGGHKFWGLVLQVGGWAQG